MMENKVVRQLNLHYFGSIIVLAALFALAIFSVFRFAPRLKPVNIAIEMYAIVITLAAIPLALKTFADRLKKIRRHGLAPLPAAARYKTAYFVRLYLLVTVATGNIALYALSGNMNFCWLSVVLFVIFFFCKSSEEEVLSLTEEGETSNKTKE